MTATLANIHPLDHSPTGDPVALAFGKLTGRSLYGAHSWLRRGYNDQVAVALRAHREAGAWGRRESWAAPLVAELHTLPDRALDWAFILEHHELDQADDGWRVNFINYQNTEARRQWCRALSRFHAANLSMMLALKREDS